MRNSKRFLALFLMFGLILGVSGLAGAQDPAQSSAVAVKDQTGTGRLAAEVRLLETINKLELTKPQIEKVLSILKDVRQHGTTTQSDLQGLLQKEKDLLLKNPVDNAQLAEVQKSIAAKRQEARDYGLKVRDDLKSVLDAKQLQTLQGIIGGVRVKAKKDQNGQNLSQNPDQNAGQNSSQNAGQNATGKNWDKQKEGRHAGKRFERGRFGARYGLMNRSQLLDQVIQILETKLNA
ncbi:MAG: hypothetical protein ACM3TT_04880 [Syntrophothermus sp.]